MSDIFLTLVFCISVINSVALIAIAVAIRVELRFRDKRRRLQNPNDELTDFISDIKTHGYGFVRVDPGGVFYRGRKDE